MFKMVSTTATLIQENHYYPFGMEMEGSFTGSTNKYRYNGKELNDDFGLNLYDYGARWYDPSVGRFTGVDPLADHPRLVSYSSYVYTVNNPVLHTDPDGRCPPWICGAIAGGLVEAGSQYFSNLANGDSWLDAAINIDGADVLAATIEGGVTGGGSVARRLLVKGGAMVVSEIVQSTVDATISDIVVQGLEGVQIETDAGKIATGTAIGISSNLVGEGVGGTMKAGTKSKHTKELTQVNRELKQSMKGSNGEAVRLSKQAELNATIKGNKVVSEATGIVTTEVLDEKWKRNQRK